ncbi:sulfatase-like hydrolase/transferase [Pseudomonas sp. AA-38]|uniref:sulfatase-like hydrolase/transferase n=1 Tax=Pseudomonas sp. AA-38 TaxID=3028807 RepID=UPI0023F8AD65|nr:sulfatase-like hydrolase/transferase [Pseudomonas sp. AA-38]
MLALILPNMVFGLAAFLFGLGRPYINIDYAVVVALLALRWRRLGVMLLLFFLLIDALGLFGQVVPFVRLGDVFYIFSFVMLSSIYHVIWLCFFVLLYVSLVALIYFASCRAKAVHALGLLNVLFLVSLFQVGVSGAVPDRFYRVSTQWWAKSQTQLFFYARSDLFLSLFDEQGPALISGRGVNASAPFWEGGGAVARLMLVVAESWGETVDPQIQAQLLEPLRVLSGRKFDRGDVLSTGMTLAGELRELCDLVPMHYNLKPVLKGFEHCLPNQLRAAGYTTLSLHAATGMMYDRLYWYPRVGFDRSVFFESRFWPRRCYSFPGGCDADMFDEVHSFFQKPGRRFLYWLTLNSHAPYDLRDLRNDRFDCAAFAIESSSEVCRNLKLQAQFFERLAHTLDQDVMRDVQVIVVGDHEPVIMDVATKNKYFVSGRVPWVYLK